jgi:hypothetical protein
MASVPPPTSRPIAAPVQHSEPVRAAAELVLVLDEGRGRRRSARDEGDRLRLSADGIMIEYGRMLRAPLRLPLGVVKIATVDAGSATPGEEDGRFAILRRLHGRTVIPRREGIEGWLWTRSGGTAMTNLTDGGSAPNVALVFTRPLDAAKLRESFDPEFVSALAARSPLGNPTVLGVLLRVISPTSADSGFRRWGFQALLTDKEVPPTQRRHLPTDRPADPTLHGGGSDARATTSIAPPGTQ